MAIMLDLIFIKKDLRNKFISVVTALNLETKSYDIIKKINNFKSFYQSAEHTSRILFSTTDINLARQKHREIVYELRKEADLNTR